MGFDIGGFLGGGTQAEGDYGGMLRDRIAGRGPSLAEKMLQAQQARTQAGMYGMAAGGSGVNSALAMRNAMMMGGQAQQANAQAAAEQKAREEQQALAMFGQYATQQGDVQRQQGAAAMNALGSGMALLSDARAKRDVRPAGTTGDAFLDAIAPKTFRYATGTGEGGGAQLGVLAQDVERVAPGMVEQGPDGMRRVDGAKLAGATAASAARLHERLRAVEAILGVGR